MRDPHFLTAALRAACLDREFFGTDGPCPVTVETEAPDSGLVVISGDNGSGKSLFLRALKAHLRCMDGNVVILASDARARTSSGFERSHIDSADEDGDSIAAVFSTATMRSLASARAVTVPSLLILDEPDIGLSETWSLAIAREIADLAGDMPGPLEGIVVASHNRALVARLEELGPSFLRVGTDSRSTQQWLAGKAADRQQTVAEMKSDLRKRWLRIEEIMAGRRLAAGASASKRSKTGTGRRRSAAPV